MGSSVSRGRRLGGFPDRRLVAVVPPELLENAGIAAVNLDLGGRVAAWNSAAEHLFGWLEGEVLGRLLPIVPPDGQAFFRLQLERVLSGETIPAFDAVRVRKDGSRIDVRVSAAPLLDAGGRVLGAAALFEDVSQQKWVERSLQETETRYQTLFERNPFPMWAYDLDSLRFLAVNDAAVEHYGYSREEFLGMTIRDIRPPEEVGRLVEDVSRVASGRVDPSSWNTAIWKHRKKDGTVFDVEVRSTTLSFGGWHARLVLAKDVSVERRLEEQLRQAQKMDAIGRLAGGVAHDFNNILFIMSGYAEQLQRRVDEALRPKVVGILKAAERGASLTRQLLMFSRKNVEEPQVLSLNTVVSEMEKMLQRLLGERIALTAAPQADLWRVKADPAHVEQVLMNLAVNARDAMPYGGSLVIETRNVEIDAAYGRAHTGVTPGPYVMLSVSDTGMGMDAETMSHIFEPFFTTKPKEQGTGLGLSIVYGIVKQSGGSIEVYSHLGLGTTFKVYLPRVLGEQETGPRAEMTLPQRGSETVLLVEDEQELRALAREILEEHGYTVFEAVDGPEAVSVAAERHPRLLITDMVLRSMTGGDLAQRLCAAQPGLRVLYMSGYTDRALVSQGRIEDGAAFLQKPFALDTLLRKVREVLDCKGSA